MKNKYLPLFFFFFAYTFFVPQTNFLFSAQEKKIETKKITPKPAKKNIERIYASTPMLLYMLYALDRDKIIGLNFEFWADEKRFLDPKIYSLPVLGGWFGQGKTPNIEMVLAAKPNLILISEWLRNNMDASTKEIFVRANIPILYLRDRSLEDINKSFLHLGKIIAKEERAEQLANWGNHAIMLGRQLQTEIKKQNASQVQIYYAQGSDGLQTECDGSFHAELLQLAQAQNVHRCKQASSYGRVKISFEQLLAYNPDVILVYEREFFKKIFRDAKWKNLRAVQNKEIYFIPKGPFSWFDRPPSFMRFLGLKWLISVLYPQAMDIDIVKEMKDFYKLFLQWELSQDDINFILNR